MRKYPPIGLNGGLRNSSPYLLLREIRKGLYEIGRRDRRFISLKPREPSRGKVLLSHIADPFFLKPGQVVSVAHTHDWESLQIARTFLDRGYELDVFSYSNKDFIPERDYSFFIDPRFNIERMATLLNEDCVRIMHIDTAHCLFHNAAEARRLLELQQRRGTCLQPRRVMRHNRGIEHAHYATILGNDFTIGTYSYAGKTMYPIPVSTSVLYPWPSDKDFDAVRKSFLWFGSGGLVHKGLDLLLDAFADMPDYHLTICGPLGARGKEKDFEQAFHKELYETPNIHTVGWMNIATTRFVDIANKCIALIYPSCSEGQAGCVITCMHAGLIPIASRESGVDVEKAAGAMLKSCSVEDIKDALRALAERPAPELEARARSAWEYARANHTKDAFAQAYRRAVDDVIARH